MVMKDRLHRLSRGAFKSSTVLTVIKRGNGIWEYEVEGVTADRGVVQLRYHATFKKSDWRRLLAH